MHDIPTETKFLLQRDADSKKYFPCYTDILPFEW